MRMRDIKVPAIERAKAEADQRANAQFIEARTMTALFIPVPRAFFRRMAGLRGSDLRDGGKR